MSVPLAASHEPVGIYNRPSYVLYVFERKTRFYNSILCVSYAARS